MKKEVRLYNVIFPVWMMFLFPQIWLIALPGNLVIDVLVLAVTLKVLGHPNKWAVVKKLWWKFWLLGFLADFVGVAALIPALFVGLALDLAPGMDWLYDQISPIMHNPFLSPVAFLWTLAAVALAGYCIYRFDRRAMASCDLLTEAEKHKIALTMAVVTAPWLFFIPVY